MIDTISETVEFSPIAWQSISETAGRGKKFNKIPKMTKFFKLFIVTNSKSERELKVILINTMILFDRNSHSQKYKMLLFNIVIQRNSTPCFFKLFFWHSQGSSCCFSLVQELSGHF